MTTTIIVLGSILSGAIFGSLWTYLYLTEQRDRREAGEIDEDREGWTP